MVGQRCASTVTSSRRKGNGFWASSRRAAPPSSSPRTSPPEASTSTMSSSSSTTTIPTTARTTSTELVARVGKATQAPHTHCLPLEMLQRLEILCLSSLRLSRWSTQSLRNLWVAEEVEEEDDGGMEDEE